MRVLLLRPLSDGRLRHVVLGAVRLHSNDHVGDFYQNLVRTVRFDAKETKRLNRDQTYN